jgi:transmembrane sensor
MEEIINRYLRQEATKEELDLLLRWLSESEKNKTNFQLICDAWFYGGLQREMSHYNPTKAFASFKELTLNEKNRKNLIPVMFRWAAVILVLIIPVYFLFHHKETKPVTIANPERQPKLITMPDKSKIWLNQYASISYPKKFATAKNREITLWGEAFFEVTHMVERPFVIHAGVAKVQVLGTSFNIKVLTNQTNVTVKEGTVLVMSEIFPGKKIVIHSGEQVMVDSLGLTLRKDKTEGQNQLVWKTRELHFQNLRLDSVLIVVEKHYPVIFRIQNSTLSYERFSGTIKLDSLGGFCNLLQSLFDIEVQMKADTVTLK